MGLIAYEAARIGRNRTQGALFRRKPKAEQACIKTKCLLTLFRTIILVPKAPAKGPPERTSCQINVATRTIGKENEASPQQESRKNSNEKRTPRPVL